MKKKGQQGAADNIHHVAAGDASFLALKVAYHRISCHAAFFPVFLGAGFSSSFRSRGASI